VVESTSSEPSNQQLNLSDLAKRVGLSYQKISSRRSQDDFTAWISSHDPEGCGWKYCEEMNAYSAVTAA